MKDLEDIVVRPIAESLSYIKQYRASVARFGDGEVDIMSGRSIPYQTYHPLLAQKLVEILEIPSSPDFLICLPDAFRRLERYNDNARAFWDQHFQHNAPFYQEHCQSEWYGSTFISRPYIDLEDKSGAGESFAALKDIWKDKDILIVEGETSRSGMGNDLFAEAKSVARIICPSKDAFAYYDEILSETLKASDNRLILLMLGPTAKVLARELSQQGKWAIDLGHIDSEYEWFQMGATHKVKLSHKHTAEFNYDDNIVAADDLSYHNQIITRVGLEKTDVKEEVTVSTSEKISIIVPVYNVQQYLKRCLDSILKQTYQDFELLLINDGSTDYSAEICQEYVERDERVKLFHQTNAGPSAARNRGIELATGSYIAFIDSDDFVEEGYLENLYQALVKNDADISICNFNSFNEERQSYLFSIIPEMYFEKVYSVEEWLNEENTAKNNLFLTFTFTYTKLFKRELFEGILFPVGKLREDDATIYKLYLKANKIAFINQGSYFYSQRSEGLSRQSMLEDIEGMIRNAEERIALLVSMGYDVTAHVSSYHKRLEKCQLDALRSGQIDLYQQISGKLDLIRHYQKGK